MCPDIENRRTRPRTGFPALSRLLASDEDRFLMMFNRFDRLAMQNLVYLQSELNDMQTRLENMDYDDEYGAMSGPDEHLRRQYLLREHSVLTLCMSHMHRTSEQDIHLHAVQ